MEKGARLKETGIPYTKEGRSGDGGGGGGNRTRRMCFGQHRARFGAFPKASPVFASLRDFAPILMQIGVSYGDTPEPPLK